MLTMKTEKLHPQLYAYYCDDCGDITFSASGHITIDTMLPVYCPYCMYDRLRVASFLGATRVPTMKDVQVGDDTRSATYAVEKAISYYTAKRNAPKASEAEQDINDLF